MARSITGQARERNEDRVLVGRAGTIDLLVVADGMGGHARGDEAADIATSFAMLAATRRLPELARSDPHAVRAMLLETIWHAAGELARAAGPNDEHALRSTLILVAITRDAIVASWIGDGAVTILRANGTALELLEPHRETNGPKNLLHSSLGPVTDGRPSWCIASREDGDVLAAMTDGLADTRSETFQEELRRVARAPDPEQALTAWLEVLEHERDAQGALVRDDNLTIAIHIGALR